MRKLVVFGTGRFGQALLECVKDSMGLSPEEGTYALDFTNLDSFRHSLSSICNSVFRNDSLLLLADVQNSPAVREAMLVLEKKGMMRRMVLMSGANVPMLAAAMRMKETITSDEELVRVLRAEAESGVEAVRF